MTTPNELAELNLNTRVERAIYRDYINKHSDLSCAEYIKLLYENDNALRSIRNLGEKSAMEFRMKYHNKHYSTENAYDIIRETFPLILMKNNNGGEQMVYKHAISTIVPTKFAPKQAIR